MLDAYDLDSGDVIHVDTGTYNLVRNVLLTAADAGVRIEGPSGVSFALLNRGNTNAGNYVVELQNADERDVGSFVNYRGLSRCLRCRAVRTATM